VSRSLRPIVCLSSQYWEGAWFRKHHFMVRFAERGHKIVYVEPSHSLLRRSGYDRHTRNPLMAAKLARAQPGVWVLTPARLLPKPNGRLVSRLNHRRIVAEALRACRGLGLSHPLWWVYDPEFAFSLRQVGGAPIVFDLVDDLIGYEGSRKRQERIAACVSELARRATRVLCTSPVLLPQLAAASQPLVVPNGYDSALFRPRAFANPTHRPTVGLVGTLFDFLDFDLLGNVTEQLPHISFVLVGTIESKDPRLAEILARANVTHVGRIPREAVPDAIAGFDVCIAPFKLGSVARAVSPLKIYEYLAMHRPVVSTPLESVAKESIGRFVDFAASVPEFVGLIEARLRSWPADLKALDTVLASCTWDARFALLLRGLPARLLDDSV